MATWKSTGMDENKRTEQDLSSFTPVQAASIKLFGFSLYQWLLRPLQQWQLLEDTWISWTIHGHEQATEGTVLTWQLLTAQKHLLNQVNPCWTRRKRSNTTNLPTKRRADGSACGWLSLLFHKTALPCPPLAPPHFLEPELWNLIETTPRREQKRMGSVCNTPSPGWWSPMPCSSSGGWTQTLFLE